MYKAIFAIVNIAVICLVQIQVYLLTGLIAAVGMALLDIPRLKKIVKTNGLEAKSLEIPIFLAIIFDTMTWVYSLLSFSKLVFSGQWEKELNGK